MIKPLIIEALEDIGPCDVETLSGHMGQSESMINSLLVNYMRKGMVRCVNPDAAQFVPRAYELTDKARREYDNGEGVNDRAGNDRGVCPAEPAARKASGLVVQAAEHGCDAGADPATTPAALPTIMEIVKVSPSPISKVEQLRRIMRADGGEMYVAEMADESGIPVKNIPGLLQNDVRIGQVHLRKEEGKSVYRWLGGVDQPAKSTGGSQPEVRMDTGLSVNKVGIDRQRNVVMVSGSKPPVSETAAAPATVLISQQSDSITVPTSTALARDLYALDTELVSLTERLKVLREDRDRKTQILLAVQQLEELMKGQTA